MNETMNPQETAPQPVINQAPPPQTTQTETIAPPPKKSKNIPAIILSIFLILALGIAGYFAYMYYQPQTQNIASTPTPTPVPAPTPTPKPAANLNTYTNSDFSFSFNYPNNWTVQDTGLKTISNIQGTECEIGKIELTNTSQNLIVYMYYRSLNSCEYRALRTGMAYNPISEEKKLTISNSEVPYQYWGLGEETNPVIREIMYNNSTFTTISNIEFLFGTINITSDLNFYISENTAKEINNILESLNIFSEKK